MKIFVRVLATAGMLVATGAVAHAQCINKAGKGTGGNDESAKFQAWEAVLQDGVEPEGRCGAWIQGKQREATLQCWRRPRQRVHHPGEALQINCMFGSLEG